jgi:PKD repeat protein
MRNLIAFTLFLLCGPLASVFALVTDLNPRPTSPMAKPAYLQFGIEPDFGTKITRVSGDQGTAIPSAGGTWGDLVFHNYPKDPVWSADQALIVLKHANNGQGNMLFLDGTTYRVLFGSFGPGSVEERWHPTIPDVMVYVTSSGQVGYWNPRTNSKTLKLNPTGYSGGCMGPSEGNVSYDGRWVVVKATRNSDGRSVAYAVDIDLGVKYPDLDLGANGVGGLDWVSISASGKYVVAYGNIGGINQATKVWDKNGNLVRFLGDHTYGHYDLGLDTAGNDIMFGACDFPARFAMRRLDTGTLTFLSGNTTSDWHASTRNYRRPGWGYAVSNNSGGYVYDKTILAIKLDGSGAIERYAHHRTNQVDYWSTSMPTPSPDGKRIMFASNWDASSGRPVQAYVLDTLITTTTPIAPVARISATPASGTAPLSSSFSASGSSDADGTIVSYAWAFGDGSTGSGASISHTYSSAGTFTAVLTVTDNSGLSNSASATISVSPASTSSGLQQGGFETPFAGVANVYGSFVFPTSGSAWLFNGSAGISANGTGYTSGAPNAPEGAQVAVLQMTGAINQNATLAAGTYRLTFHATQRINWQASWQVVRVQVDAQVLGDFRPASGSFQTITTPAFTLAAGTHNIRIAGVNPNGGDNSAFIDQVALIVATPPVTGLQHGGFETPFAGTAGVFGSFIIPSSGSAWTFSGAAISANGSGYTSGNPPAPEGGQVAVLQGTAAVTQSVSLSAGTYALSFKAAQRLNWQASWQVVRVQVDGVTVGDFRPASGSYQAFTTAGFTVPSGSHVIRLAGVNPNGGDNSAFIDAVTLAAVPSTTNYVKNAGFELDNAQVQTMTNWSTWGGASLAHADADFTESGTVTAPWRNAHSGIYHGTHWKGMPYEVYTYQIVTGLPSGTYTMTAWVRSGGGQAAAWMGATNSAGVRATVNVPATGDTWMQVAIPGIVVSNGQCEIGFYSNAGADQWLYFDDVTLVPTVLAAPNANG